MRTSELCLAAVRQNGMALEYVSEEMRIPEICLNAYRMNQSCIRFIPEKIIKYATQPVGIKTKPALHDP